MQTITVLICIVVKLTIQKYSSKRCCLTTILLFERALFHSSPPCYLPKSHLQRTQSSCQDRQPCVHLLGYDSDNMLCFHQCNHRQCNHTMTDPDSSALTPHLSPSSLLLQSLVRHCWWSLCGACICADVFLKATIGCVVVLEVLQSLPSS